MRNKNSSTLIIEKIGKLEKRKSELISEQDILRERLEILRESVINGNSKTSELTTATTEFNSIENLLTEIDVKIESLRLQHNEARKSESREFALNKMVRLAKEGKQQTDELTKLLIEGNNYLREFTLKAFTVICKTVSIQSEFRSLFLTLVLSVNMTMGKHLPEVDSEIDSILDDLQSKTDLSGVRSRAFSKTSNRLDDDPNGYRFPNVPFLQTLLGAIELAKHLQPP